MNAWLAVGSRIELEFSSFFSRVCLACAEETLCLHKHRDHCIASISKWLYPITFFQVLSSSSSSVFVASVQFSLGMRIRDVAIRIVWLEECFFFVANGKRQIQLNFYSNAFSIWKCHSKSDTKQRGKNTLWNRSNGIASAPFTLRLSSQFHFIYNEDHV